ncbi:unnamed protein product [Parnassius apollo]|uniref:(apollo) hypothetical protein n=1 Tax=Parnassius apollo TaxID=110799 RepID=A0A8S3X167_PARAO|nr:unnamed protein product [Parnassius apollo]
MEVIKEIPELNSSIDQVKNNVVIEETVECIRQDVCHKSNGVVDMRKAGLAEDDNIITEMKFLIHNHHQLKLIKKTSALQLSNKIAVQVKHTDLSYKDKSRFKTEILVEKNDHDINENDLNETNSYEHATFNILSKLGQSVELNEALRSSDVNDHVEDKSRFKTEILVEKNDHDINENDLNETNFYEHATYNILSKLGQSVELNEALRSSDVNDHVEDKSRFKTEILVEKNDHDINENDLNETNSYEHATYNILSKLGQSIELNEALRSSDVNDHVEEVSNTQSSSVEVNNKKTSALQLSNKIAVQVKHTDLSYKDKSRFKTEILVEKNDHDINENDLNEKNFSEHATYNILSKLGQSIELNEALRSSDVNDHVEVKNSVVIEETVECIRQDVCHKSNGVVDMRKAGLAEDDNIITEMKFLIHNHHQLKLITKNIGITQLSNKIAVEVNHTDLSYKDKSRFKTEILVEKNDNDINENDLNEKNFSEHATYNILSKLGQSIELNEALRSSDVNDHVEGNNYTGRQEVFKKEELLDILQGKNVESSDKEVVE